MSASHPHGHNGTGLSPEEQRKLWDHVRALEVLDEQVADIKLDISMRKELVKADGFDTNIVAAIIKRRKAGEGETRAADTLVRIYEEALQEQGVMPLEQTRRTAPPARRSVDDIADELHGQEAPRMPEKNREADRDSEELYVEAKRMVRAADKASTSWLQRQLQIGFNQAARLIERMEADGVVSRADATGRRVVLDNDPFAAARTLDETLRASGATATLTTGDGQPIATFGAGSMFDD